MTEEVPVNPEKDEREAWGRIASTADGKLAHRHLRRILEGCRISETSGALQRHEGARILARELMALMAPSIEANRDRTRDPDDSILASTDRAVAVTRNASGARRGADAPGWEPEPDASTGTNTGAASKRAT